MKRIRLRLRSLFRRAALDRDLDDELSFHLEMLARDRDDAKRQFGNATRLKEACREMWTLGFIEIWVQDLRYGLRTLVRNRGFTAVAVTALALGIGVNATVFSLVNAILFKNLPFAGSDRVLYVRSINRLDGSRGLSYPDYVDFRAQTKTFEALAAVGPCRGDISDTTGFPQSYSCSALTANSLSAIAVKPVVGRDFEPADEAPGAAPVVILGYGLWEKRYGKDPSVVGRSIRLNSIATAVIGVMPRDFRFPGEAELWTPLTRSEKPLDRADRQLTGFGRLAPGTTIRSARAEMETMNARLAAEYPVTNHDLGGLVETFNEMAIRKKLRMLFLTLLGAVGFVLLIACANVANLLLARAVERTHEISIRAAMGAGRLRIIRQLLVESVLLGVAGGAAGWPLAVWGSRAFDLAVIPTGKPAWIDFSLDYHVLLYLSIVSIGTGILFGLAPALRLSQLNIGSTLKEGGRGAGPGVRGRSLSGVLVVVEMSLAVILLAGAGLMLRGFRKVSVAPLGVNPANVLAMKVDLPPRYGRPEEQIAFHQRLKERLEQLPGVDVATVLSQMPGDGSTGLEYQADDRPRRLGGLFIGPDYFRVMQVKPLAGRLFGDMDGTPGSPVAIVNQAFVNRFWPHENPLGKRVALVGSLPLVVGVVPDIAQNNGDLLLREPLVYQPYRQQPRPSMFVAARTRVPPGTLAETFRRTVQSLDRDLPVREITTLDEHVALLHSFLWIFGGMFGIFAAIAFLLASVGLYAVIAHSVNRRTQEIGVRLAMGATASGVMRLILTQGMRQLAAGLAIGLAAAFALTRVLGEFLVGVSPRDPLTFFSVALVLTTAGLLGCAVPARRAIRVDPAVTLRHE